MKKEETWCNNDVLRQKLAACLNAYEADMNTATPLKQQHLTIGSTTVSPNDIP
jgi:hypothetical protein